MPLDLRPLAVGELFDRAFVLYRRHFSLFVGITAVPGLFALIMTLAQQAFASATMPRPETAGNLDPTAFGDNVMLVVSLFAAMMISLLVYWVVYMIALGATTFAVSEIYVGRTVTIPEVYGRMRGRIGALIVLLLLIGIRIGGLMIVGTLTIGLGAAFGSILNPILGGLFAILTALALAAGCTFLALRYSLSIPALVLEGLTPGDSIRRSIELSQGRLGRVFLMVICATLVAYAALVLFQGPFVAAAMFAGLETTHGFWLNVLGAVAGTIGTTLTTPFLIIGLAVIYYDARIREEGFDLELSLAALDR
jgi:hypothetical protein